MINDLELCHTHFRQMRKHLAAVEKAWSERALVATKESLDELRLMADMIEEIIKNQLYRNLSKKEVIKIGEEDKDSGRRAGEAEK